MRGGMYVTVTQGRQEHVGMGAARDPLCSRSFLALHLHRAWHAGSGVGFARIPMICGVSAGLCYLVLAIPTASMKPHNL